jgi:hypothetical protein
LTRAAVATIEIAYNLVFSTLPSFILRSFLTYFSVIYNTQALMSAGATRLDGSLFSDYLKRHSCCLPGREAPSQCENVFALQWLLQRSNPK